MRSATILVISSIVIIMLWHYPVLDPLKILVVFFHETSHALASLLTGGTVLEMVVETNKGGHVLSSGGNRFIVASAGYLGSLLWGILIYIAASLSKYDKGIMGLLGLILLVVTVVFMRNGAGLIFGIVMGSLMSAGAYFLSHAINDILLRIIGISSMLYVPLDIYDDTIRRAGSVKSDATTIAETIGGTTMLWGILWGLISIVTIALCLLWTVRHPELHSVEVDKRH